MTFVVRLCPQKAYLCLSAPYDAPLSPAVPRECLSRSASYRTKGQGDNNVLFDAAGLAYPFVMCEDDLYRTLRLYRSSPFINFTVLHLSPDWREIPTFDRTTRVLLIKPGTICAGSPAPSEFSHGPGLPISSFGHLQAMAGSYYPRDSLQRAKCP